MLYTPSLGSQAFPVARNCLFFLCGGGKHLKLGKAWDETSREGRRWVDALARAAVSLTHKLYILARAETFDVHCW